MVKSRMRNFVWICFAGEAKRELSCGIGIQTNYVYHPEIGISLNYYLHMFVLQKGSRGWREKMVDVTEDSS